MSDAYWGPLYDLYAFSQDGKPSTSVSLHYRVNISQGTGEDWKDAKLILSTSETDILNAGVPTSDGLIIEPKQPPTPPSLSPSPPPERYRRYRKTKQTARRYVDVEAEVSSLESDEDDSAESLAAALPEMSGGGAVISKTPMAVNYTVDELTTIPSDNGSHKVLVAIVPFEATISHITTPRKSPLAYLQVCPPLVSVHRPTYCPSACSAW